MNHPVFFQPADGWVGDLIPFEKDGEFWLFYLHEVRTDPKPGTAWHLVTTKDLTQFQDHGVSLPHGSSTDLDFNAYTGSIVLDDAGVHHVFYTGQNPDNLGPDGLPLQLAMHATSTDGMQTWVKHPELTFGAPAGYEPGDWRDPFIFRDGSQGPWRMLLAARHGSGPGRRRGVIAQCVSDDLLTWRAHRTVLGPAPLHHPRMPRRVCLGRLVVHGLLRILRKLHHPVPDGHQPRRSVDRAGAGQHRRPRVLRLKDRRPGTAGDSFRLDRQQGRKPRRRTPGSGRAPWPSWRCARTSDGTLGFGLADEVVESFWDEVP